MNYTNNRTGFTIVELLIVVVVIAILAAITIVAYNGIRARSEQSARLSEMSQLQKTIQVDALQNDGVTSTVGVPLVFTTNNQKDMPFVNPVVAAQDLTLYVVFDTNGVLGSDWSPLVDFTSSTTSSAVNSMRIRHGSGSYVGVRIDTNASSNATGSSPVATRNTTGRHVGWVTAKAGNFYVNFDRHDAITYALPAHTGWNFDSVRINSGLGGIATIAFAEYHDEATRQQVLRWLDRKYSIDFYN